MHGIYSTTIAQDGRSICAMKERLNGRMGTEDGSRDSKGAEDGEKQCQVLCKNVCKSSDRM